MKPVLETHHLTKKFAHITANYDISITLYKGEIIAFLGENGAGKSTLMNMLFGLYKPTSGDIFLDGEKVMFSSPREAIARGLGMVHQHFMLVPTLTVSQNIILGHEPVRFGHILYTQARDKVMELSKKYGLAVDPDARLDELSVGMQQRVEILKALYRNARILILDEPTAVLTPIEVQELFLVLKKLAADGTSIIIITHKLEEVKNLSERVYILRRGKLTGECRTADATASQLATLMVGRDVVFDVPHSITATIPNPVLRLEKISANNMRGLAALKNISLQVGPGEIVGVAGVEGNGQRELCDLIAGLIQPESGRILFHDTDITRWNIRRRMDAKLGYIPQDRRGSGLVLSFSVEENLALGRSDTPPLSHAGLLDFTAIRAQAEHLMADYDIRAAGPDSHASTLSGGNQQKLILAREFSRKPEFLLVSQPTRGLDVGAIEYVYRRLLDMRDRQTAILLVSMELEELFALSDRLVVMHAGKIVFQSPVGATNELEIGEYMIRGDTHYTAAAAGSRIQRSAS